MNWNYLYAIIPIGGLVFVIGSVLCVERLMAGSGR